ncbi:serine/threonine-protein kinase, partial [Nitrolancea hollandica]|uniref:serine/threonine-protein kinase n=1 Tax=Nitrolancea hollandica TaxID=1206749 RepID=UPI001266E690
MFENQGTEALIGRSFHGFRITRFIARGGMGVVFQGIQESLARPVAIKFLYPHLSGDPTFRERFEREARAVARLNHPNIVRVLDFGSEGPLHFIVMDFIDGESLRDRLASIHGAGLTFKTEMIVSIVQQVGSALSYAHRLGYIHRDVKPGNILLAKDGQVYLTDFGVVKIIGDTPMTVAGTIVGTPEYMSPEQSSGDEPVTPLSDLYSLAVVTYELMVGRVPFQAPTPIAVMRMQHNDPPPLPSSLVPWFPPQVEAVLMRALAKNPEDRYESVDAFVTSLLSVMGSTIHPRSATASGWNGFDTASTIGRSTTGVEAAPAPQRGPTTSTSTPPPATAAPGPAPSPATSDAVSDRSPRRPMIMGGAIALAVLLAILGGFALVNRGGGGG